MDDGVYLTETDNQVLFLDIFGSWMEVGMVVAAVITGMAFILVPWLRSKTKTRREMVKFWSHDFEDQHTQIHERLTELRVALDCGRVSLFQFHNGGQFIDGTSMRKFSVTHESCALGVMACKIDMKELLLTRYMDLLGLLKRDNPQIHHVENMTPSSIKSLMQSNNVICFSLLPFHCQETNLIMGYICVEWCSFDKSLEISEEHVAQILPEVRDIVSVGLNHG